MWDALWRNGKVATMTAGANNPFGLIEDGAVAAEDGRIAWIGAASALPGAPATCARAVHDLGGRLLTPGLVDPHNHAVYDGDALGDFELLTQGGTRGDMIAAGGGVGGLVRQTRAASDGQIYAASAARVAKLIASGMTTLESKSGAGLDLETSVKSTIPPPNVSHARMTAIALVSWPAVARLVRAEFIALRHREFVQGCRAVGMGDTRIIFRQILPNALAPIIVTASIMVATAILTESALARLGLGDANVTSGGSMIGAGREMLRTEWYSPPFPGSRFWRRCWPSTSSAKA